MRTSIVIFLFLSLSSVNNLVAQRFYRLSGNFSIREIVLYGESDSFKTFLTRGFLDYDRNKHQVVFDVTFPEKEHWILQDSVFYKIKHDTIYMRYALPYAMQMLNFDFLLSGYNYDFFFQKIGCTIEDIRKEEEKLFKLWKYPDIQQLDVFKYILMQEENGHTTAIAYLDEKKQVVSREFYKDFKNVNGLDVPHVIEQRVYSDSSTYVKKLILSNVSINNTERDTVFRNDLEFLPIMPGADEGNLRERFGLSQE